MSIQDASPAGFGNGSPPSPPPVLPSAALPPAALADTSRKMPEARQARPRVPGRASKSAKLPRPASVEQLAALATAAPAQEHVEGKAESAFAWLISATFNIGILLLALFIAYMAVPSKEKDEPIIVPNGFEDPAFSEHPGGIPHPGAGEDPARDAAQNLKQLAHAEGWSQSESTQNLAGLLGGASGETEIAGIFAGAGGSMGGGGGNDTGGKVAAYGTPGGGAGNGPKSSFYGTGGNATRIVYILDHSGSMLDNYEFLKMETKRSINNLVPLQWVGVVMFAENAEPLPPGTLVRAVPDSKRALLAALDKTVAQGKNNDDLPPFKMAFQRAFAMNPQLIYFLTDGKFDPDLIKEVSKMNADKKVSINTLAFVTEEPSYKELLQQLARENHGVYKFITERELGH